MTTPWPDIEPYRAGNTGIPFVWSFDSRRPGPHAMINGLTHGNEPCGAIAVARLLDAGLRPARGRLTLALANVEAYARFRATSDRTARFLDRDLNRLWRDDWIEHDRDSRETARARLLRPILHEVDALLDLHSTAGVARPFFVLAELAKSRQLADAIASPPTQQLMPGGCAEGRHLIDYGRFADPAAPAVALALECGRHADAAAGEVAHAAALRFLSVLGITESQSATPPEPIERFRTVEPYIVRTDRFRLHISELGFARVVRGELVATDGEDPVYAPFDTVILAPRPSPATGEVAFLWSKQIG